MCFKMMVFGVAFIVSQTVWGSPVIFNFTKKASPGDVITIQGSGFTDTATVWLDVIEPGEATTSPNMQLSQILSQSDDFISVKMPEGLVAGFYAISVYDGATHSEIALINKAEGWNYLDLAGSEITPGFSFRISGRNLVLQNASSQVRFVNKSSGAVIAGFVDDSASNESVLACQAPSSLVAGQEYYVEVCNGSASFNDAWARVNGNALLARVAGTDVFGLGVPWAAEVSRLNNLVINAKAAPFNAVGNGVADDRAAIQLAIDYTASKGGGTVYLPGGTYNIGIFSYVGVDYNLILRANVVLKGEGINQTTLISQGANTGVHAGVVYALPSQKNFGLHSLTVIGGSKSAMAVNVLNCTRSFLVNTRLVNEGAVSTRAIAWREGGSSVFKDCEFISTHDNSEAAYFARHNDLMVKNCFFEYHDGRVSFLLSKRVQVEACTFARSVETSSPNHVNYGGLTAPHSDFTLLDSSFVKLGDGPLLYANDGEAILCEYPSNNLGLGVVSDCYATSIQDTAASWQAGRLVGCEIVIIKGPGTGQRRTITSNTVNSLVVSQPWQVQPIAGESRYSIGEFSERHLIQGCVFNDSPRGIWYYRTPVKGLVVTGNFFTNTAYPVLIRANQRVQAESYSLGNEFNTISHLLVENNVAQTNSNFAYAEPVMLSVDSVVTSGSVLYGGFYYDCALRDNVLCGGNSPASSGFYIAHAAPIINNTQPSSVGMILQRNWVEGRSSGVSLGTGNHRTMIFSTGLSDTPELMRDAPLPFHTAASVGTVVGE